MSLRIKKSEFSLLVKDKEILISPHALWHLSNKQRKVFNKEELIDMIKKETPRRVNLQINGRYGAYYRKSDGFRKLILKIEEKKIIIITFMNMKEILKND
jgi:hypothetical protein